MHTHFKGTNYELSPEISRFAEKKLRALRKFAGKQFDAAQAFFDLGKITSAQNTGKIWRAELNFDLGGERFNASAEAESLETAIEGTIADVGRELERAQRRERDLVRKGGSVIKSFIRGFQN